jgi:hypothetical protein
VNEQIIHIYGDSASIWHIKDSPQWTTEYKSMNFAVRPTKIQILAPFAMGSWEN